MQDKRELRVFLSSTFRDMQDERDYLIKHVFPGIRQACRERLVEFTEIDLRWGVTKEEAEQGKVVRICLEEIDRCRPYFMSFLGERYGWSPVSSDIECKHELITQFPVVEESLRAKKSVTEMEILHGVINNPEMTDHGFFYFRAPELTQSLGQKSGNLADYLEGDNIGKTKLIQLKSCIRASGFPLHENYPSVEELGEHIKQDLLNVLDERYPKEKVPTPLEAERLGHEAYAKDRCKAYIPNPADSEALNQYIQSQQDKPLVINGESGLGKSALLAYWLAQYSERHPNLFIIQHYAGISGDANAVAILRRIIAEIKERTRDAEELPSKPEDAIKDFPLWLAKVRQSDPLLLILDGLNQIEADNLNWLPPFWPATVRLIVSILPSEGLTELQSRGWNTWLVQPMDTVRRNQFIKTYLQGYRKVLSTEQTDKIVAAPQCGNPLFLRTVLEELRIFGVFEQLDTRITGYLQANNSAELFTKVLARMEHDYGETTVSSVMRAIWAARRGLSETELLGITGINRLDTSILLCALDYHLVRRGGLLNFFHDYLRQAVKNCYLPAETEQQLTHLKLANYFDQQMLDGRKAEELPWQWQQIGAWERLKDCISDIPMFDAIYNKNLYELLGYWLRMGNLYDLGESYSRSFAEWEARQATGDSAQTFRYMKALGAFLRLCARYTAAEPLIRRALAICEKVLGPEHPDTASCLNDLAGLLLPTGNYAAAESLLRRSLAIDEKVLGPKHPNTGTGLNNLAELLCTTGEYAAAELLYRRSLAIYEDTLGPEHSATASGLNNLAELLSHTGDYTAAEPLHRRSLVIREKALGPVHPGTAAAINNLAGLLHAKGDYAAAEPLYRRALTIYENTLGPEHPDTATAINNLAGLLHLTGDYTAAEPLYHRALTIREKVLGPEHPDTATGIHNLAGLLSDKGDYAAAGPLVRRALAIYEKVLGSEHPNTISGINILADLLHKTGDYAAAEPLYRRVLAIREKTLGSEHPHTAIVIHNLGLLLSTTGNYAAAEPLYRSMLTSREKIDGPEHPNTATAINNLAEQLYAKGDYAAAEP